MSQRTQSQIILTIKAGDALKFQADVLALKYAQAFYGVDAAVAELLSTEYDDLTSLLPKESGFRLLPSKEAIASKAVLFVGVKPLSQFGYQEIREFGRKVLISLADAAPETKHLCLTIHGPGYGLDETEAFESEIAGLLDAVKSGDFPAGLQRITIVERNFPRANRLNKALAGLLPGGLVEVGQGGRIKELGDKANERLRSVGYASGNKQHIFVAMPFADEMDDIFHYGIQGAVNAAGFLCERADLSTFTGDVVEWVKNRISSSALVIADLSTSNPNVYLEVGFAWGCGRPTVLLCHDAAELKFDVKNQRCLVYKRIKDLEESLRKELENLRNDLVV
ncbi:MAG: hypothetical protein M3348_15165 [Acidobacteriota bacterium]|nr:hypothetical protein [Acidobacteriota bacterium]